MYCCCGNLCAVAPSLAYMQDRNCSGALRCWVGSSVRLSSHNVPLVWHAAYLAAAPRVRFPLHRCKTSPTWNAVAIWSTIPHPLSLTHSNPASILEQALCRCATPCCPPLCQAAGSAIWRDTGANLHLPPQARNVVPLAGSPGICAHSLSYEWCHSGLPRSHPYFLHPPATTIHFTSAGLLA